MLVCGLCLCACVCLCVLVCLAVLVWLAVLVVLFSSSAHSHSHPHSHTPVLFCFLFCLSFCVFLIRSASQVFSLLPKKTYTKPTERWRRCERRTYWMKTRVPWDEVGRRREGKPKKTTTASNNRLMQRSTDREHIHTTTYTYTTKHMKQKQGAW